MGVLEVTRSEGYLTITLNDPEKRNLLSPEMVDGLYEAMAGAEP